VPGWEGASLSELSGGLNNRTWLVEKDGIKGVLKIDQAERSAPYNSRPAEARLQMHAADRGLANAVLYADDLTLMTEFIDGNVWNPDRFREEGNIERLAMALRQLHALPLSGRSFDAMVATRRYVAGIRHEDEELVALCMSIVGGMRQPHNLCCCHNDLVAENIITTPSVKFLDWEYACDNDPMFDLATVVEHHELPELLAHRLLDAYFDGDGERWRATLAAQQRLYRALYWLWLASRAETDATELETVAARLR
jgi:thiamine kinase-like enzyme